MSSVGQNGQPPSTRSNPRRRVRAAEDTGSVRQQPQRKRSKLSTNTFNPPDENDFVNGDSDAPKTKLMNGQLPSPGPSDRSAPSPHPVDMPHRTQPQATTVKGKEWNDGTTTLTSNSNYVIQRLPGIPSTIRSNKGVPFRGYRLSSHGHALVLTRDQALIWDYTTSATSPPTRSLNLPYPTRQDEPVSLGAFVSSGSNADTGLVVVNPTNGKISFWESIENADALSLFEQRRNGVEGSCGSLMYGETVTDITDAGSAGFVLSFSSGRAAQILVRDSQSRPSISVQYLRKTGSGSGLLGTLKNVFGAGGWLHNVAGVLTRASSTRGQTDAFVCSEDGTLQIWQLNWAGQIALQKEIDFRPGVIEAVSTLVGPSARSTTANNAKIIDLALLSGDMEETTLLLLISFGSHGVTPAFALVAIDIDETSNPRQIIHLSSYTPKPAPNSSWKPKIYLPPSGIAVFVVFETAITFVSLSSGNLVSSNSHQITEANQSSTYFQDTIYFREGADFVTCGACVEENRHWRLQRSVVIFLHNFGLLRIQGQPSSTDAASRDTPEMTVKSKIEQAVYFGILEASPLDLNRKPEFSFSLEQVQTAALEVSREILASNSPHIPTVAASMELHLQHRARHLKALAAYLRQFYPDVSRVTKWVLRWDAEKLAAAHSVWAVYDKKTATGQRRTSLLNEAVLSMSESFKSGMNAERGENDPVRHFFIHDISEIGTLIGLAWPQLKTMIGDEYTREDDRLPALVSEADDIIVEGLGAAYKFRSTSADLYGLEQEPVKEGLLADQYTGLPEFWTSMPIIWMQLPDVMEHNREYISDMTSSLVSLEQASPEMQKLTEDLIQMLDLYCKISEERCRWELIQEGNKAQEKAHRLAASYESNRQDLITSLPNLFVELADDGMRLAEKYSDLNSLVGVIAVKSGQLVAAMSSNDPKIKAQAAADNRYLDQRIGQFFKKYGDAFAKIMYTEMIKQGKLSTLLDQAAFRGQELTHYLRHNAFTKKVSWINEILFEKNRFLAAKDLLEVANSKETEAWNKKVELSISKLALSAVQEEGDGPSTDSVGATLEQLDNSLELVKLQEIAFEHVRPCLYHALDDGAELQLAMDAFGKKTAAKFNYLHQLLERAMEKLVRHKVMSADQLIDLLTLMSPSENDDKQKSDMALPVISGQESLLAFRVLKSSSRGRTNQEKELLLKIIWRRCFIRDNWQVLNKTKNKSDENATNDLEATTLFKTLYEGYAQDLWSTQSGIRILSPGEVIGAGTNADEHTERFKSADLTVPLARDMAAEDKELTRAIDKFQLEHWAATTKEMAEQKWAAQSETKEEQAQRLGSATEAIYNEDEDLRRGTEKSGISIPRTWREIVKMGLGY